MVEQNQQKPPQERAQEKARRQYRSGQSKEAAGRATAAAGSGVRAAGRGVQAAGRGMTRGGAAVTRAGAGLTGTGVGAVAGVPLMIGGAATTVAGVGTTAAGTGVRAAGTGMRAAGRAEAQRGRLQKQRATRAAALAGMRSRADDSQKISKATKYLMYSTAIFFDLIIFLVGLIPVAGQIIAPIIGFLVMAGFIFWFLMKGVRPLTSKRLKLLGIGFFISLIPFIPPVTFYVIRMIASTKNRKGKMPSKQTIHPPTRRS